MTKYDYFSEKVASVDEYFLPEVWREEEVDDTFIQNVSTFLKTESEMRESQVKTDIDAQELLSRLEDLRYEEITRVVTLDRVFMFAWTIDKVYKIVKEMMGDL